ATAVVPPSHRNGALWLACRVGPSHSGRVKVTSFVLLLCLAASTPLLAKEKGWSGNYTDNKYLNGEAVFQLNILQEGDSISVDFDAAYKDGHGCAPEASGPAKVADKNTLKFTFSDSFNNSGTGTIKRVADGV